MTAPEADWAGYYDVLLEPEDEPWDPLCGVVQAWNRVTVQHDAKRPVLGVLSGPRLEAVRCVYKAFGLDQTPRVAPRPGHVALRPAGDTQWVLTGTPLSPDDVRLAYQALYREVARHIR